MNAHSIHSIPALRRWTGSHIVQRAGQVLQEEGLTSLWFKILGETVYRRMVFLERLLDQPIPLLVAGCPARIGLLLATQIDSYLHFRSDTDPAEIHQRLTRGQYCFVAWLDGQIIHAGWVATDQAHIEYLDRDIDLSPGEVYTYESFTLPAYRAQGLASAYLSRMLPHSLVQDDSSDTILDTGYVHVPCVLGRWFREYLRAKLVREVP